MIESINRLCDTITTVLGDTNKKELVLSSQKLQVLVALLKLVSFCKGLTDILQADDKSGVHRIILICQLFEKAVTSKNFENNAPLSAISGRLLNSLGDRLFLFLKDIPLIFFATLSDPATKMSFVNTASSKLFFEKQCKLFGLVNNLQCKEWICQMLLRCPPKNHPNDLGNPFLTL